MLPKYENLIFKDEKEMWNVYEECAQYAYSTFPDEPKEKLLSEAEQALSVVESRMLFDLCAGKFGNKIWCKDKVPKDCKVKCPFDEVCDQDCQVGFDGQHFCYGQLYYRGIKDLEDLYELADKKQVTIYIPREKVYVILNEKSKEMLDEYLSVWFLVFELHIAYFGDLVEPYGNSKKIYGEKFIARLQSNSQGKA